MPLTKITITHRYVRVHARNSIRTGNDDLERDEEVQRGHPQFTERDRARTEDGRNESRTRGYYGRVPSRYPSSNRHDSNRPGQTENTFHTPSRQPPSREQNEQRRHSSYRLERYKNTIYTNSSQTPPGEQSDQTGHFSHRMKRGENTTNIPRQASPREPTQQTKNSSHRIRSSDHTPYHHSPRQAPAPSREKIHQSESSNIFNNYTLPSVAPRGGDLYKTLNVSPEASHAEIVRAARRRRIEAHPDRLKYPGMTQSALDGIDDEAQNVGLAADTLCDEVSRRKYDSGVRRGSRS